MRGSFSKTLKVLSCLALAAMLSCSLCSCKPTDFFTEIIIDDFATEIDYDNPDSNIVNSPDAEETSGTLSAISWSDISERSEDVQNLVTYSSEPTVELTTHHSVFDPSPLIPGIEASDGVRVLFDADAELEHESEGSEQEPPESDAQETSVGSQESTPEALRALSDYVQQTQTPSDSGTPSEGSQGNDFDINMTTGGGSDLDINMTTGSGDPDPETPSESGDPDPETPQDGNVPQPDNPSPGPSETPSGGFDGTHRPIYDPDDAYQRPRHVSSLAVIGTDVAVLAQSLGGKNAISAMSEYAYNGLDSSGRRSTTALTFADVFADEADNIQLIWKRDGSSPSDLTDVDALVEACGADGLIVYDQNLGDYTTFFTAEQYQKIYDAGIQMAPVDTTSLQGLADAANLIGEALSESDVCAQDAQAMRSAYVSAVNSISSAVSKTHMSSGNATCFFATESSWGMSYSDDVDASGIVLFTGVRSHDPLNRWAETAGLSVGGLIDGQFYPSGQLSVLWPVDMTVDAQHLTGGSNDVYARWANEGLESSMSENRLGGLRYGIGSQYVPYLVVCSTSEASASEVKNAVVESIASYGARGVLTPYSALHYGRHVEGAAGAGFGTPIVMLPSGAFTSSTVGINSSSVGGTYESPFFTGLSPEDVVLENPCGLLGSWTDSSMEAPLEAIWLADMYSRSPEGCEYVPVTSMSGFSVKIGDQDCTSLRDAVLAFYQTFYRYNASWDYSSVVTDEGR